MNKSILLLVFLILLFFGCESKSTQVKKSPTNDSIQKYLKLAGNDSLEFDKRIQYNDKALSFLDLTRNDSLTREYLKINIRNFYLLNDNESLKKYSEKLHYLSKESNDSLSLGIAEKNIGVYYMNISENELAIKHLFYAKEIFNSKKNIEYEIYVMSSIALTQYFACDYLGSNKTVFDVLKLSKKANLNSQDFFCKNLIANNLCGLKQYKKAINYYLSIETNNLNQNDLYMLKNNIASTYLELGYYSMANLYLNEVIDQTSCKNKYQKQLGIAKSLLALSKIQCGKNKNVLKLLLESDYILRKINSNSGRNYNQIYFSKLYDLEKDTLKAIEHAKKAVKLSKLYNNPSDVLKSLSQLIKVDSRNSKKNAEEYIRINDSLQIAERNFRDKFAQITYETDEISQQKDSAIKQKYVVIAIALSLLIITLLVFIIARQRLKQKELRLIQTQQNANEEIYQLMLSQKSKEEEARQIEKRRIGMELHDGVMNKLVSTRLNLSVLFNKRDNATIEKCIPLIHDIHTIESEIRNLTHSLNQNNPTINDSFEKLLLDFVAQQKNITTIEYDLQIDPKIKWETINDVQKMNLFRIIQEASHNINKHSNAKNASLSFVIDHKNICLSISDDGIGIDSNTPNKGIGLKNIDYRVQILKGKFHIHSEPNKSTSLNISFPLN